MIGWIVSIVQDPIFFIVIILILMILVLFRFEVAMGIGLLTLIWLFLAGLDPAMLARKFYAGIDNFVLLAVPFFIMVGEILKRAGMSQRLFNFSETVSGRTRGGLAHANVIGSLIFGGIQGAAMADVATLGTIFIPAMRKKGYPGSFAAAITATSSLVAPLIPPSIMLVILGAVAEISIGGLLAAAIVPGLMIGFTDMIIVHLMAERRNFPRGVEGRNMKDLFVALKDALAAIGAPAIILFGLTMGVVTPAEAGILGSIYALIIGTLVYRSYDLGDFYDTLKSTVEKTSMVLIIIGFAISLGWIFAMLGIGPAFRSMMLGITTNPTALLGIMCIFLLFIGTWLESTATIFLIAPLFYELSQTVGIHPLQFGIVFALMINIAMITPPMGMCLFVAEGVSGEPFLDIAREALPFLLLDLVVITLVVLFPEITLFVPRLLGFI